MIALSSRVPGYTTNLTMTEVATMTDLHRWSRSVLWGASDGVYDYGDWL